MTEVPAHLQRFARTTDPSSSEARVTDIVTDTDRIDGLAVLEAIREAGWSIPGSGPRWFTDDDIKDQYDRNIGHGDTTRNDLARHRLRWEQQNPPALVRDPTPRPPLKGGRAVLHFRLAREGDTPRPERPGRTEPRLTDERFTHLMGYVMGTDPHPTDHVVTSGNDAVVQALLHEEAAARGFSSWYDAYHVMVTP